MVSAQSGMDVSEDCNALLLLDESLEDSSDTALDELSLTIVYAPARRWTCLASVSSADRSWFIRKLRMD